MVQAFWEMSNAGNNIDITLLSGGIYEAMITTVGGLVVDVYKRQPFGRGIFLGISCLGIGLVFLVLQSDECGIVVY